jgi:hypothetical protein
MAKWVRLADRGFCAAAVRYWRDDSAASLLTVCFGADEYETYMAEERRAVLAWLHDHSTRLVPPSPPPLPFVRSETDPSGRSISVRLSLSDLELLQTLRRRLGYTNRQILSAGIALVDAASRPQP